MCEAGVGKWELKEWWERRVIQHGDYSSNSRMSVCQRLLQAPQSKNKMLWKGELCSHHCPGQGYQTQSQVKGFEEKVLRTQLKLETINLPHLAELCDFLQESSAAQKMKDVIREIQVESVFGWK